MWFVFLAVALVLTAGCGPQADAPVAGPPSGAAELTGKVAAWEPFTFPSGVECRTASADVNGDGIVGSAVDDEGAPPLCAAKDILGDVLVRNEEDGDAVVTVTRQTEILVRAQDGGYRAAAWSDIRQGQDVDIWTSSGVLESAPVQARAGTLVLSG